MLLLASKDDTKVTSYLWEIVGGPMTDQLASNTGNMLKLKDLTPGNYTVRLTVSDEEGEKNSTLATVIVTQVGLCLNKISTSFCK